MMDAKVSYENLGKVIEQTRSFDYSKNLSLARADRVWTMFKKTESGIKVYCAISNMDELLGMRALNLEREEFEGMIPVELAIMVYEDYFHNSLEARRVLQYHSPNTFEDRVASKNPFEALVGAGLHGIIQKQMLDNQFSEYMRKNNIKIGSQAMEYIVQASR